MTGSLFLQLSHVSSSWMSRTLGECSVFGLVQLQKQPLKCWYFQLRDVLCPLFPLFLGACEAIKAPAFWEAQLQGVVEGGCWLFPLGTLLGSASVPIPSFRRMLLL